MRKTYAGKTANQILKNAYVAESRAGFAEIWMDSETQIHADYESMTILNSSGCLAEVEMTPHARAKLRRLTEKQEREQVLCFLPLMRWHSACK